MEFVKMMFIVTEDDAGIPLGNFTHTATHEEV
jgi:hypothetical protein